MKRQFLSVSLGLLLLAACSPAPLPSPTPVPTAVAGMLSVDPGTSLGPISPYIYGSNYGPWTAVPMGKMDYALNSHITTLRWPGGEWGDANDIQIYQLDQFIAFCEQIGAMPTISVRLLDGTPAAAAELVRYVNIEKKHGLVYWSIGNEPDLYEGRPNVDYDTVRFNQEWRAIADAMRAVDPTIKLLGPELHGTYTSNFDTNPKDTSGRDWMTEFLKANGDLVDVVTYHRYPFPKMSTGPNATVEDMRQDLPEWTLTLRYLRGLVQEITGRDLPLGVTEANSHYSAAVQGEATPDSFYNAIWWSDALGRMINENVFIANQFLLTNSSSQAGGLGLISARGIRPMYYVYQMYSHFGTERLYASSGVAGASIYAARREDGALTILVINLADTEQRIPFQVQDVTLLKAEVWRLDSTHNAESLGEQLFPADGILTLPAQSVTLYVISKDALQSH